MLVLANQFRDRFRFEKRLEEEDPFGNTEGEWQVLFTRRVCLRAQKGGETVLAQRLQSQQPVLVIVRRDSETSLIQPDWRLVDERTDIIYAIHTVYDMERHGRHITLLCETGVVA